LKLCRRRNNDGTGEVETRTEEGIEDFGTSSETCGSCIVSLGKRRTGESIMIAFKSCEEIHNHIIEKYKLPQLTTIRGGLIVDIKTIGDTLYIVLPDNKMIAFASCSEPDGGLGAPKIVTEVTYDYIIDMIALTTNKDTMHSYDTKAGKELERLLNEFRKQEEERQAREKLAELKKRFENDRG